MCLSCQLRRWLLANHSRTKALKTPNVNLVKSTFNLNLIPHKNNQKWACVRDWLASRHCRQLIDLFLCNKHGCGQNLCHLHKIVKSTTLCWFLLLLWWCVKWNFSLVLSLLIQLCILWHRHDMDTMYNISIRLLKCEDIFDFVAVCLNVFVTGNRKNNKMFKVLVFQ